MTQLSAAQAHSTQGRGDAQANPAPSAASVVAPRRPVRVAQPNWAALGFGSAWEAEGRN